jgi:hypothetical protein
MLMSAASIPVFEIGLNVLSALLDKAEAYAQAKKIDPTALLGASLFPGMLTFSQQIQRACDAAKDAGARLADTEPPRREDSEKTIAELKARIAKTIDFLKTLDTRKTYSSVEREINLPIGPKRGLYDRRGLPQPLHGAQLLFSRHHRLRHPPSLRRRHRQERLPRGHSDEDNMKVGGIGGSAASPSRQARR